MRRSLCSGREPSTTLPTSDCSASYMLSVSPIRCVTEHCGLSVNYHKDKKVSSNVSHMQCVQYIICVSVLLILSFFQTTGLLSFVVVKKKGNHMLSQSYSSSDDHIQQCNPIPALLAIC